MCSYDCLLTLAHHHSDSLSPSAAAQNLPTSVLIPKMSRLLVPSKQLIKTFSSQAAGQTKKFVLPELGYAFSALEPAISGPNQASAAPLARRIIGANPAPLDAPGSLYVSLRCCLICCLTGKIMETHYTKHHQVRHKANHRLAASVPLLLFAAHSLPRLFVHLFIYFRPMSTT